MINDYNSLSFNLTENSTETYYISKYVYEAENKVPNKIITAMTKLLIDGYLQNASYENIVEVFELLTINKDEDINWNNSIEINDMLEKYF